MRAKNREINIFNMSLMDVLTGALGAFVFLMLSFVPYYNIVIENNLTPSENQKEKESLKNQASDLKNKVKELERRNQELQEKVDELVEKLKKAGEGDVSAEELARLEDENNRLKKELEELKDEIAALRAENRDLRDQVASLEDEVEVLQGKLDAALADLEKLRAENEELKKKLASITPGDPQAESKLRELQAELLAIGRSVFIGAHFDGDEKFEFVVRDPNGYWFDTHSYFPFGRKSIRVNAYSGWDAQDFTERDERANSNVSYIQIEGLLVPGDYIVGVRLAPPGARFIAEHPRSSVGQDLLKLFGSPSGSSSSSSSGEANSKTSSLIENPFSFATDAFAQSSNPVFESRPTAPVSSTVNGYPVNANRHFMQAIARVMRTSMRPSISEMPIQTIPVERWVSVIARIRVVGSHIEFRWFNRLSERGALLPGDVAGLASGRERKDLEEVINSQPIEPLYEDECVGPSTCNKEIGKRGDITIDDLDPSLREKIILPQSNQSPEGIKEVVEDAKD